MCLECSGKHRALGVHISFVRSVTMDSWSDKQISSMRVGGNEKCNAFLRKYGIEKLTPIDKKYNNAVAMFYRNIISAEAEGAEPPVPPESFNTNQPDSNDYVQQELKAREEARERLRQKFGGSAGLSSKGGVMQGIGSDSSYAPGPQDSASFSLPVDMDQLADASKTAFSFLSSSLSTLGDSVMKTATALIDEKPGHLSTPPQETPSSNRIREKGNDEWATAWASLSSTATNLWKSAAVATADIVNNLQQESSSNSNNEPNHYYEQTNSDHNNLVVDQSGATSFSVEERAQQNRQPKKALNNAPKTGNGSSDDFFATFGV